MMLLMLRVCVQMVYPKSDEQRRRLNDAVKHILLFRSLEEVELYAVRPSVRPSVRLSVCLSVCVCGWVGGPRVGRHDVTIITSFLLAVS